MSDWRARRAQYLLGKDDLEHPAAAARLLRPKREKKPRKAPEPRRVNGELSWAEKEMTKRALASVERILWLRERDRDVPAHFRADVARTGEPNIKEASL